MFVEESMRNSLFTLALAGAFAGCSETSITKVLDTEAGKPPAEY